MGYSMTSIFLEYVCPSMGCILATMTFAAPVRDLRQALQNGSLDALNPFPWTFMTGNTLGWVVYAYYTNDPFVLAANLPGLIMSLWLNMGAAKLQYMDRMKRFKPRSLLLLNNNNDNDNNSNNQATSSDNSRMSGNNNNNNNILTSRSTSFTDGERPSLDVAQLQQQDPSLQPPAAATADASSPLAGMVDWDASPPLDDSAVVLGGDGDEEEQAELLQLGVNDDAIDHEQVILVPQEQALLRILIAWSVVVVAVGWFPGIFSSVATPATTIGLVVNLNLIVFYGAPLQSIQTVILTKRSDSIHIPTMLMTCCNTTFWILYGATRRDVNIIFPNAMGCLLGLAQGCLCFLYPRSTAQRGRSNEGDEDGADDGENGDDDDRGQGDEQGGGGGENSGAQFSIS